MGRQAVGPLPLPLLPMKLGLFVIRGFAAYWSTKSSSGVAFVGGPLDHRHSRR